MCDLFITTYGSLCNRQLHAEHAARWRIQSSTGKELCNKMLPRVSHPFFQPWPKLCPSLSFEVYKPALNESCKLLLHFHNHLLCFNVGWEQNLFLTAKFLQQLQMAAVLSGDTKNPEIQTVAKKHSLTIHSFSNTLAQFLM